MLATHTRFTNESADHTGFLPGFIILLLWCLSCIPAQAVEIIGKAEITSEYSSNTLRTDENAIGEWIHQPGFDITARQDSALWTLDANYHYLRRLYEKDFWGDESIATGQGSAHWQVLPQRLDFFINNRRTESSISAIQTQTPDNRQVVSNTRAGTILHFHPGGKKNALQLEYSYADSQSSNTQSDSKRHNGKVIYTFATWPDSSMQFQADHSDISFSGLFPDADSTSATLSYAKTTRKLVVGVKFGHNWYRRSGRGKSDDSTYDVVFLWRASDSSTLRLSASHAIVDQSTNLSENQGSVNENTGINAAFIETRGNLSFSQQWGRTKLTLSGIWSKEEYAPDVPLDNDSIGFSFELSRRLTRTTSATLGAKFNSRDFTDQGDNQDEITANLRFNHQIGRTIDLNWGGDYVQQDSTGAHSYDGWRVSLTLVYTFIGAR